MSMSESKRLSYSVYSVILLTQIKTIPRSYLHGTKRALLISVTLRCSHVYELMVVVHVLGKTQEKGSGPGLQDTGSWQQVSA